MHAGVVFQHSLALVSLQVSHHSKDLYGLDKNQATDAVGFAGSLGPCWVQLSPELQELSLQTDTEERPPISTEFLGGALQPVLPAQI